MIGFRLARHVREIVITQRVLLRVGPIGRNIGLRVLQSDSALGAVPVEPRVMVVGRVMDGIARVRERGAIRAGERPKVVIEGVVLLHNNHNMLDET